MLASDKLNMEYDYLLIKISIFYMNIVKFI